MSPLCIIIMYPCSDYCNNIMLGSLYLPFPYVNMYLKYLFYWTGSIFHDLNMVLICVTHGVFGAMVVQLFIL